jgi:hypothetical protein
MGEDYLYGERRELASAEGWAGERSEVRGQIAEVKSKYGFHLCNLTSDL